MKYELYLSLKDSSFEVYSIVLVKGFWNYTPKRTLKVAPFGKTLEFEEASSLED
ncbi:conserved hypothetical protein [Ricinus communis]|uniref:Uncharacterized protein n=1 Tax=Ricinus communis TaxID=3988 RepID=B9RPI7_RICCO|nr:conserved hypothetical protein [Ricinus communis]